MTDPLQQLEHDHEHITRLVDSLRESTQACLRGEEEALELRVDIEEFVRVANEELYEHFDLEENGLFPYVIEQVPELEEAVSRLEAGHDRMCGLLARMERFVALDDAAFEAEFDGFIALFARFDANYVRHSREEFGMLRALSAKLDDAERKVLGRLLADL